jgi:hypothetical protein
MIVNKGSLGTNTRHSRRHCTSWRQAPTVTAGATNRGGYCRWSCYSLLPTDDVYSGAATLDEEDEDDGNADETWWRWDAPLKLPPLPTTVRLLLLFSSQDMPCGHTRAALANNAVGVLRMPATTWWSAGTWEATIEMAAMKILDDFFKCEQGCMRSMGRSLQTIVNLPR